MSTKEAPDQTVQASNRAIEVATAFNILRAADTQPDNIKHLWSLAAALVSDLHRGQDSYPVQHA